MMRMEGNGVEDDSGVVKEECGVTKGECYVLKEDCDGMKEAPAVATDPIARNEEPIVLEEVTIRKRETIPLKEPEVSKDVTALEEPETSKDTIPLKEPEMLKEAPQGSEHRGIVLTDHSLSLEERMEQILTTMDHQITSSDQARAAFRPPRISPPSPRPSPTLSISRLLFVYINHRGCAVAFPPSHHA